MSASRDVSGGEHAVSDHAVLELVAHTKCTAYDCEHAALAIVLGTILVTEDKALRPALPKVCRRWLQRPQPEQQRPSAQQTESSMLCSLSRFGIVIVA